ncbi:MAG: hypothetical protein ACTSQZ_06330 [Candidatus Thorarchaeota archaeon]
MKVKLARIAQIRVSGPTRAFSNKDGSWNISPSAMMLKQIVRVVERNKAKPNRSLYGFVE